MAFDSNNDIIIFAKSSDPDQQKLRDEKSKFNKQLKLLVAHFQGLKNGISGRGSAKMGIPPSNIKDPLPGQVGSLLSEISSLYVSVIEQTKSIIEAQNYYSSHRRKPKEHSVSSLPEQPKAVASLPPPQLTSEASWAGSRLFARLSLLRKLTLAERRVRLDMLGSLVDLSKGLKSLEKEIVDYKNPESVPSFIRNASRLSSDYISVVLRLFNKFQELYQAKGQASKKELITPHLISLELWKKFQEIYSQLLKIEIVVDSIKSPDITKFYEEFHKNIIIVYSFSKKTTEEYRQFLENETMSDEVVKNDFAKKTLSVVEQYQKLLNMCSEKLGKGKDFNELESKIVKTEEPSKEEKPPVPISIKDPAEEFAQAGSAISEPETFEKASSNAWLNKKLLSINPNNLGRMKLELADSIHNLRSVINLLMDVLENREQDIIVIGKKLSDTNKTWVDLLDQILNLAKNYVIVQRTEKQHKNPIVELSISDLRTLKDLRNEIAAHIKVPNEE